MVLVFIGGTAVDQPARKKATRALVISAFVPPGGMIAC
jgi:hypothetical protein